MVSQLEERVLAALELELRLKAKAKRRSLSYITDPVGFIQSRLGATLWSKQREIAVSVVAHKRTAAHSAHATGKSFLAARIAAWWITCHPPGEAFVVTTAPTFSQVRSILWREIRRAHSQSNLPGRVNQTEWMMPVNGVDELVAFGRKPSDYDEAAFQGIHSRYVLVILDEAAGIPADLYNAVESITTNDDSRILAIGNPDNPSSYFAHICTPGGLWNVVHVNGLETPAFTGEEFPDELLPYLISRRWVEEQAQEHGEDSPWYQSRVLGIFPENAENTVVPLSWAQACKYLDPEERPPLPTKQVDGKDVPDYVVHLGVDVGAGGDETSICVRQGPRAIMHREWSKRTVSPEAATGLIMSVVREWKPVKIKVDSNGIGWAICGMLRKELKEAEITSQVVPVNVGTAARRKERFPKMRDELWWEVGRELSRQQVWDLTDVPDAAIGQLTAPQYALDSSGRTKVEQKDETRKRLGRSPDLADALLLAFYDAPGVAQSIRF